MSILAKIACAVLLATGLVALFVGWAQMFVFLTLNHSVWGLAWGATPLALIFSLLVMFVPEKYEQDDS